MWKIAETTGDPSDLQKIVDEMNKPENLEPVYEEIWMAERRLAEYKARDPEGFAEFERQFDSIWEATHRRGSVPSIKRKRD